jgi:hypothetical protein
LKLAKGILLFVIATLFTAELIARSLGGWLWESGANEFRVHFDPEPVRDKERCFTFRPSSNISLDYFKNSDLLWRTSTSTDKNSRRRDGNSQLQGRHYERALVLLGGSDVFGVGVKDSETLASHLSQLMPNFRTYNYGYPGAGPNQALALLSGERINEEILEERGVFIYLAIPHHIRRAQGSARILSEWYSECLAFRFDDRGNVSARGSFRELNPYLVYVSELLAATSLGKRILVMSDIPVRPGKRGIDNFLKTIKAMGTSVQARFPGSRFVLVLLPRGDPEASAFEAIKDGLIETDIVVVDATAIPEPATLLNDSHLSSLGYSAVAKLVASKLNGAVESNK